MSWTFFEILYTRFTARFSQTTYLFLLAGGGALAVAAMGPYAVLIFTPAVCAVALLYSLAPQQVHRWTFCFQMSWQTLCHLGLHYTEYYLHEPPSVRLSCSHLAEEE
ncbi:hypothetical protein H8959_003500 [Pygathrix nigripes]